MLMFHNSEHIWRYKMNINDLLHGFIVTIIKPTKKAYIEEYPGPIPTSFIFAYYWFLDEISRMS
jgi:hypothetical protein